MPFSYELLEMCLEDYKAFWQWSPSSVPGWIFKGDLTMKAYARFDEILTLGYFLKELSISDAKFANLVPLWRHL